MKKVLIVIAKDIFRDEEFQVPYSALKRENFEVVVASSSKGAAKGKLGAVVDVQVAIADVNAADFDAVIFVGGAGASEYFDSPVAHSIAQKMAASGKIVAAICIAPVILLNAGLLVNKKVTSWYEEAQRFKDGGAIYLGTPVEVDGNIITGNGPQAAAEFAGKIIEKLKE